VSSLVQTSILGALQGIQNLAADADEAMQAGCKKQMQALQTALRYIHKNFPAEEAPEKANDAARDWAIDPERAEAFGQTVEKARRATGLSRGKLAERAGLSEQTIYNVEAATNVPTHATVVRLLSVPELGLVSEQVPWRRPDAAQFGSSPNCWIAPGYDPLKMFLNLFELVNGRGGSIEQTFAYLDHRSAVSWYQLCNQSHYASKYRARMPLDAMAQRLLAESTHARFDVFALGSGDGKSEVRLVQHLLDHAEEKRRKVDVRLHLLDISQPLLSAAYQHAAQTLGKRGVYICAVQGDFHHWPQYAQFHYTPESAHRRRIICMLGNTIGSLDNEVRFFQHTLIGLAPGDVMLLDIDLLRAPIERPDEIELQDVQLRNGLQPGHIEWLSGPLRRYCDGAADITLALSLDLHTSVPGSYMVDTLATVRMRDGQQRRFSIFRFKCYEPGRFVNLLRSFGWDLLEDASYGPDPATPAKALLLFHRVSPSQTESG
jgi:transcriptional regulator with XRE-family HTH domain